MSKNFKSNIIKIREDKQETNSFTENKRLTEKISELKEENKSLQNILSLKANTDNQVHMFIDKIKLIDNIRTEIDHAGIDELKASLQTNGQLQPVLITKDNYLIAGYRRYTALKEMDSKSISVFIYQKNYEDIKDSIKFLQFDENEKRKSIDNFDISKLFNDCLKEGYQQSDLSTIFGKSKGFVSSVLRLSSIHKPMIDYIREFQIYAYSHEKFIAMNSTPEKMKEDKFYQKNRGVVGWQTLYAIAKHDELPEQKKAFLRTFKNRLTEEELNSKYFKAEYQELIKTKDINKYQNALKSVNDLKNLVDNIMENIDKSDYEDFNTIRNYLLATEEIFIKKSEKSSSL